MQAKPSQAKQASKQAAGFMLYYAKLSMREKVDLIVCSVELARVFRCVYMNALLLFFFFLFFTLLLLWCFFQLRETVLVKM